MAMVLLVTCIVTFFYRDHQPDKTNATLLEELEQFSARWGKGGQEQRYRGVLKRLSLRHASRTKRKAGDELLAETKAPDEYPGVSYWARQREIGSRQPRGYGQGNGPEYASRSKPEGAKGHMQSQVRVQDYVGPSSEAARTSLGQTRLARTFGKLNSAGLSYSQLQDAYQEQKQRQGRIVHMHASDGQLLEEEKKDTDAGNEESEDRGVIGGSEGDVEENSDQDGGEDVQKESSAEGHHAAQGSGVKRKEKSRERDGGHSQKEVMIEHDGQEADQGAEEHERIERGDGGGDGQLEEERDNYGDRKPVAYPEDVVERTEPMSRWEKIRVLEKAEVS